MSLTRVTSALLADGGVMTPDLADKAVTLAKLADGPPNTVLQFGADGRPVASASTLADGSVTNAKIAAGTLSLDRFANGPAGHFLRFDPTTGALQTAPSALADSTVTTDKLAAGAVTLEKMAAGSVGAAQLVAGGVGTNALADLAVTTAKLAAGAVTTAKLAPGAVTDAVLAAGAVTAGKLAGGSVGTAALADDAVTLAKLAHGPANQLLGTDGTGAPAWVPPSGGGGSSDLFNVRDYGAVGDGTTDDSAAIQAAINAAQAANGTVFIDRAYNIATLGVQSGRFFLRGDGDARLIGTLAYEDTFPISADTASPLSPTAPYIFIEGVAFEAVGTAYGLTVSAQQGVSFLNVGEIRGCQFYGRRGARFRHCITLEVEDCRFVTTEFGMVFEGCANVNVEQAVIHNTAGIGVWITSAPVGQDSRKGGENIRFSSCEWAVCSTGLRADNHMWLRLENCLFDYCGLPLDLRGTWNGSASLTYFGTSGTYQNLATLGGYAAPAGELAVLMQPTTSYGTTPVGMSFDQCEFVDYSDTNTPLVRCDGNLSGALPGTPGQRILFARCVFMKVSINQQNAPSLLDLRYAVEVHVVDNIFYAPNSGPGYLKAYQLTGCLGVKVRDNNFHHSYRPTAPTTKIQSDLENAEGTLRPYNPGGVATINAVLRPAAMDGATPTFGRGIDFTGVNFTTGVAAAFKAGQWLEWSSVNVLGVNGSMTELRSNGSIALIDGNANRSSASPGLKIDSAWNGNPVWLYAGGKLRQVGVGPAIDGSWNYLICGN